MEKTVQRKFHLYDAQGKILGRLASELAKTLSGRNKVDYTPNIDAGDFAVVINSDKIMASGRKMDKKLYHHYSGYPGGIKTTTLKNKMESDSKKVIWSAVYGMLPKNKLRKEMLKRLRIHTGDGNKYQIDIKH